jgi:hypothetical protein
MCIESSRAEHRSHPADSADMAPIDFFFGYIKGKRFNHNYVSQEDLLNAITEIFTEVDQEALLTVLESWVNPPKWVLKHERKYYTM